MFGRLFKKKEEKKVRRLDNVSELQVGDIIVFKPRDVLPEELQSASLTVKRVSMYEYGDGMSPEFTLECASTGHLYHLALDDDDEGVYLSISKKLSHNDVVKVFNESQLASLWEEGFARLDVNTNNELTGWLPEYYEQSVKEAAAYFYNEDKRGQPVSEFVEQGAQELRYHECCGSDDKYSLNIEIWEDGDTDIYLLVSVPENTIDEMWPNGD